MRKMIVIIATVILLFACGVSENQEIPDIPETPAAVIKGSFESKFVRYKQGDKFAGQTNENKIVTTWSDTAWINDRIHKQLILWTDAAGFDNITYETGDLAGVSQTIAAANVRLRFLKYVLGDATAQECNGHTSRNPVSIADALSLTPVVRLSPDDPLKIWITIDIPANTTPGKYAGNITVKADGKAQQTFNIELLVANRILPEVKDWTFHLDLWQFPFQLASICKVEPFSADYFQLIEPFYKLLADAGQKAITAYIKDGAFLPEQTMVKWTKNQDNTWTFDYTDFDKYVETLTSWGIDKQINCFSLIGWNTFAGYWNVAANEYQRIDLKPDNPDFETVWNTFLTSFKEHLDGKGWFDKTVLYMDESKEEEMAKVVSVIKSNHSDWKIGLASSRVNADIERKLYDYSTILGYNRQSFNPVSTFYTSCSQKIPNNYVTLENNPAEMTWMAWHAATMGYRGYLRWAYDYWTKSDPANIQDGSNSAGDYSMIYRANNSPANQVLSGIRLELLREGIQDYEKIKILSDARLNAEVKKFSADSGNKAAALISEGESLIKSLSVK